MKLTEELAQLRTDKLTAEAALAEAIAAHAAEMATLQAQLETTTEEHGIELREHTRLDEENAALRAEIGTLKASTKSVEDLASRKALDIAAGQGIPPVAGAGAAETPTDPQALWTAYATEKDPKKRGAIWLQMRAAKLIN